MYVGLGMFTFWCFTRASAKTTGPIFYKTCIEGLHTHEKLLSINPYFCKKKHLPKALVFISEKQDYKYT